MVKKYFTPKDSKSLAYDIICFCKKWGLWKDVSIFTGGKGYRYTEDSHACFRDLQGVEVFRETDPDKWTSGLIKSSCGNLYELVTFSNQEHLLDMTFEGPLYTLLRHDEYEVKVEDLPESAKRYIVEHDEELRDRCDCLNQEDICRFMELREGWDPAEFDSYEEYLSLVGYDEPEYDQDIFDGGEREFESREELENFIMSAAVSKEASLEEYFSCTNDVILENLISGDTYYGGCNVIATTVKEEFTEVLEKYGLRYELGFSWCLTAYRIER